MGMLMKSNDTNQKEFWTKKEGPWAKLGLGLMVIAVALLLGKAWPHLIAFVNGAADFTLALVRAGLIVGVVGFIVYTLTRPKIRTMLSYWYKGLISFIVNGYVSRNYVQIMRTYIADMQERLGLVRSSIRDVSKGKGIVDGDIDRTVTEIKEAVERRRDIESLLRTETDEEVIQKLKIELNSIAGSVGDADASLKMLRSEQVRLDMMLKVLRKAEMFTGAAVGSLSKKVERMIRNHETISKSRSVFMHAREVAFGGSAAREMFDDSYELMLKRTDEDKGDIDAMMEEFKSAFNTHDVNAKLSEEAGKRLLAEWDQKMDAKLQDNLSYLESGTVATPVVVPAAASNAAEKAASKYLK